MIIAARYSFNRGKEVVESKYSHLLSEIEAAISNVDAEQHRIKQSQRKDHDGPDVV